MIDFKALLADERNLGKNPAMAYRTETFQALDAELEALSPEEKSDTRSEALEMLEEHRDSLILPYIAGRLLLMLRPHEYNMRLNNILLSFYEARNWDVVKYIGGVILSVSESSKALRVLGDVAGQQGDEELKWNYYERLVRTDSQDHDIIVVVADHYEGIGDKKNAMNCYQRALNRLMHAEGENVYASFARLTPETSLVIAAAIALKPFINEKEATVRDAMKASDMLLLQHFFEDRKEALHYSDSDMHQLMHLAAFFCVAGYLMADKLSEKPIDILAYLLADEDIRKVANVNEYQGVTWYNKEMMQLIIVLAAISAEVFLADSHNGFDGQAFIADLLEREEKSGYKLEVLLSPVIEEKRREKELKEAADKAKANRRKASSTKTAKTKK